jgi:hypothetical protein
MLPALPQNFKKLTKFRSATWRSLIELSDVWKARRKIMLHTIPANTRAKLGQVYEIWKSPCYPSYFILLNALNNDASSLLCADLSWCRPNDMD